MNERIRELEKQATETVKCGLNGTSTAVRFSRKKFAELIIKECLTLVNNTPVGYSDYRSQIEEGMRGACVEELKHHFGVE